MQFIVSKQIAVEADSPEDAVAKAGEGKTISVSANLRLQRPQTIVPQHITGAQPAQQSKT